uniref:Phostensin/Taperin PP1-binding domain-containing protein n=1 Tax=Seriola dumerili TaxID=41447 RepID=A0A3B4V8N8_SERDU
MSVSSLPEWKQLLLEKKRREEEERERREKEEEEKLASMPAWKRGIIQRRKAKQESVGDKEKERDALSQVSLETIVPVHENPFIRTQSAWRKGRDADVGNEPEIKEKEKEKSSPKGQDGESGRERGIELKIERFRDLSEGREKERSRDRSQGRERENSRERLEKDKSQSQGDEGQDWEGGQGVERRDSWRIGKPLSRIESLREKIRQRELEKLRQRETQDGDGSEAAEINDTQTAGDKGETEIEQEWEAAAHMRKRMVEAERGQEDTAAQTSMAAFDVTQETQEKDQSESNYKMSPQRVCSPTSQVKQTITVNPSFLRSQSPDNTLKPSDCAPTPASSPSSPSPAQSPSISPSPTPSPTLFSIRSASGGQVKRGSTSQAQITSAVAEPTKKKFPTVEEIEVIGGYQNLEKSCLVKNRGTPKKVKVCFDEDQLEQVCEYPSETSMLVCTPYPHDLGRPQGEEVQLEEADVEGGAIVSKSTSNVGTATGRGLRVGQCHPLLKKHNV